MNGRILFEELEKFYPGSLAESWDNPGLQAGRRDQEIRKVYIALDQNMENIEGAIQEKADLLLTHHPLLIGGIKSVTGDDLAGRRLLRLIESGTASYAMHTNYDVVTMGELAASILGLSGTEVLTEIGREPETGNVYGYGRIGGLPCEMTAEGCAALVKERFGLECVKVYGKPGAAVRRAAILPGAGKDMVEDALKKKADVYITGDFSHHAGLDAEDEGLVVIDAGHYGIEHIFIQHMAGFFGEHFPGIQVVTAPVRIPGTVI